MLRIFDPTVNTEESETDVKLAPLYRNAKAVGGVLPGEFVHPIPFYQNSPTPFPGVRS